MLSKIERVPILTAVTAFFILGIPLSEIIPLPFFILAILVFILLVSIGFFLFWCYCEPKVKSADLLASRRSRGPLGRQSCFLFLIFLCALGLGILHTKNYLHLPGNHIAKLNSENISDLKISGMIDSDPVIDSRKTSFIFRVDKIWCQASKSIQMPDTAIPGVIVQGLVLVNVFSSRGGSASGGEKFAYGNRLILSGKLFKPFDYGAEDNFSYRDYLRNQGIFSILNISKDDEMTRATYEVDTVVHLVGGRGFLKSLAFKIKYKFRNIFNQYLKPLNSRILNGIILGDRQELPDELRDAFIATGTAHIIAISGFNVGIIVFILLIFLKALGLKRKARYALTIPLLLIHMYAVGLSASVVRATVMAVILLSAYLIESEAHLINSLSLAALIILGFNPLQIYDAGFQLSFISVLGIVFLSPKISALATRVIAERHLRGGQMTPRRWGGLSLRFPKIILTSFSVSLSAWLSTAGIIAYYFRVFSPITVLANLIVVPLASLVIILGFTLAGGGIFLPIFAGPIAASTDFILLLFVKIVFWFSHFPFACFYFRVD